MVMLTQLLRFEAADGRGRRVRVADACIALLDDDYPPVTHLIVLGPDGPRRIDWADVSDIDWADERIHVKNAEGEPDVDANDLLLARDLMDSLVLDLLGRRTTRVGDLWLHDDDGFLRLKGVDAGLKAMIRRVTGGRLGKTDKASLFDWRYVEFLRGDPEAVNSGAGYRLRINRLPAGEIARLADYVPYLHAAELLKLLPDEKAADVLQAMSIERQVQIIEELDEHDAVDLIRRMSPDLATDLLGRLHLDVMRNYIDKLPADRREKIVQLLRYPEDSVGGVMLNDLAVLPVELNAEEAQSRIHAQIKNLDFVSLVFLVDDEKSGRLRGSVPLRDVLAAGPECRMEDLMDPYLETLHPFESAGRAAYRMVGGQHQAMPVVDRHGVLLGAMTLSSAISLLLPSSSGLRGVRIFT